MKQVLSRYFDLSEKQKRQFDELQQLVFEKNQQVNLISRKDQENIFEHHILHSLTIGFYYNFSKESRILDVGTGGGFPGIPLAILFPEAKFHLIDGTRKKIDAVKDFASVLGLKNVEGEQLRAEENKRKYHFVISRAVTRLAPFTQWVGNNLVPGSYGGISHGIFYLRGLDFDFATINDEIDNRFDCNKIIDLEKDFGGEFFKGKHLVFLQRI